MAVMESGQRVFPLGNPPLGSHFAVPQQAELLLLWKRNEDARQVQTAKQHGSTR